MSDITMNTFDNVGKKWTENDIKLLKTNYTTNNLSVYNISIILKRTMYGILCKLKSINLIDTIENANGYDEYMELREKEKDNLNEIKISILKSDYLENNLSVDELVAKYDLPKKNILKQLFSYNILKEEDKKIYDELITNKENKSDKMNIDIQELKKELLEIKTEIKEFKNAFNQLIGILTKK